MKYNLIALLFVIVSCVSVANAEGMVFDPTVYSSTPTKAASAEDIEIPEVSKTSSTTVQTEIPTNTTLNATIKEHATAAQSTISGQTTSFNNALFELDTAQVNIRNQLLEYKAKYQEIDTQYKLIKEQRKVLGKQINSIEKQIKNIEKSKNNIRKTMI